MCLPLDIRFKGGDRELLILWCGEDPYILDLPPMCVQNELWSDGEESGPSDSGSEDLWEVLWKFCGMYLCKI